MNANARRQREEPLDSGTIAGSEIYPELAKKGLVATPVSSFLHVHLSGLFLSVSEGLIVETSYVDVNGSTAYWLARVTEVFGYYVKLRWLGDEASDSGFWKIIGSYEPPQEGQPDNRVFHVGYAASKQKLFEAPRSVPLPEQGMRRFLAKLLVSAPILTENIHDIFMEDTKCPLSIGDNAEAEDVNNILALRPVVVDENKGGRLRLRYIDQRRSRGYRSETWLHMYSPEICPPGMAGVLGRILTSTPEYKEESWKRIVEESIFGSISNFAPRFVPRFLDHALRTHRFKINAKLEVLDRLKPGKISVGTIVEILEGFWLNIKIEGAVLADGKDHIVCLHASSHCLLPAGWAVENDLGDFFQPPSGFSWENCDKVPRELLQRHIPKHAFKPNQLLEAVGISATAPIYISQIRVVKEPLMLIRFFGFEAKEDAFIPITSLDIYPVGWCESVRHRLKTPGPAWGRVDTNGVGR